VSRSTLRRRRIGRVEASLSAPRQPRNALSLAERAAVLDVLNSERFADLAAPQVFAQLLDEGVYLCSLSTMYRLLRANDQVRERRRTARHPEYRVPELVATAPRQVLTWDITKVRGPEKGVWYSLFVMIDIFSRYVVGWMLVANANAEIAKTFIASVLRREGIKPGQTVVHADRGTEMTAYPVCMLLDKLGVARSYSRPRVSNDNPYSESAFKTLKYQPTFPARFGSLADARRFCSSYFNWYNHVHRHSGIRMLTPAAVHHDLATAVLEKRHAVMQSAFAAHPDRFAAGEPKRSQLPAAVWINEPIHDGTAAA
jgi:putative transposase